MRDQPCLASDTFNTQIKKARIHPIAYEETIEASPCFDCLMARQNLRPRLVCREPVGVEQFI